MKIVVYGAGESCEKLLLQLEDETVLCVADKDPGKTGKKIGHYDIITPADIKKYDYDMVLVCVDGHVPEVRRELTQLGIDNEKIVSYGMYKKMRPKNIGTLIADWNRNLNEENLYVELCRHVDKISELEREFLIGKHNRSYKWLHYFEIYNRHFSAFYGKDIAIMEIGVNQGGSLQLWKKMFGPHAKIIGVDIMESCRKMEEEQTTIYIGDQGNREFWRGIKPDLPSFDIVIDDGGHGMEQQIVTFEEIFPLVKPGGVYLCEDTGTSYDPIKYHSGCGKSGTFIEYSKNFIDYIHAWTAVGNNPPISERTRTIHSLHYYFGALAIEKREMFPPLDMEICNTDEVHYAISHLHGYF